MLCVSEVCGSRYMLQRGVSESEIQEGLGVKVKGLQSLNCLLVKKGLGDPFEPEEEKPDFLEADDPIRSQYGRLKRLGTRCGEADSVFDARRFLKHHGVPKDEIKAVKDVEELNRLVVKYNLGGENSATQAPMRDSMRDSICDDAPDYLPREHPIRAHYGKLRR